MSFMQDEDRAAVREQFAASIKQPVHLALFLAQQDCEYCELTRELISEVCALHDDLHLAFYDLDADAAYAAQLGVDKAPALVLLGGEAKVDYGIRFYGIPSGYEFASLLEALRLVGGSDAAPGSTEGFQPATQAFLGALDAPMHLQVFVTPSCPYCPRAVVLAHRLAYASPSISADAVEVSEFPELGARYEVMGVPMTMIGDHIRVEGAVPEGMLVGKLKEALLAEMRA